MVNRDPPGLHGGAPDQSVFCKSDFPHPPPRISTMTDDDGDLPSEAHTVEPSTPSNKNPPASSSSSSTSPLSSSSSSSFSASSSSSSPVQKQSLYCSLPLDKVQTVLPTITGTNDNDNNATGPPKKTSSGGRKVLCLYCDRSFVNGNLRAKHVERCHSSKQFRRISLRRQQGNFTATTCVFCDKLHGTEHTLKQLFQHLVTVHSSRYFGCLQCEDRFLNAAHLSDHNASTHRVDQPPPKQPPEAAAGAKKWSFRPPKIALKRSKRLQAKVPDAAKRNKRVKIDKKDHQQSDGSSTTSSGGGGGDKIKGPSVNPYPEFDNFFRVKKITDHSIDNLKIQSLTFDDVFDKSFFNRIACNIQENLLNHIDGKLFENEESESRISNFEKAAAGSGPEVAPKPAEHFGCQLSLNAVTPATAPIAASSQFGEDPESQIEYGSKPSKKASKTATVKKDEVHYKYFTRRKYQASILEHKENRDLSKLDMWTQYVVKNRQQRIQEQKKSPREILEYFSGEEYKNKIQREELNRILDRRGPFEDLREEVTKQVALDKLSSGQVSAGADDRVEIASLLGDILDKVCDGCRAMTSSVVVDLQNVEEQRGPREELPGYLVLRRTSTLPSDSDPIDLSDRITLICSSRETENYELPTNSVRGAHEQIELTGEWARSRIYVCAACGLKLLNIRQLLEHKSFFHQNVWAQHYEFVGNQSELYRHLSIPALGKVGRLEAASQPHARSWKRSEARMCTKCWKQCNSLGELHRHVLECGGDWTWMMARKKCKYRPYGARTRRKRRGLLKRMYAQKTEPTEKKVYKKYDGPRQKPSDADTIQRMLANLPAKRATRKIVSLKDGLTRKRRPATTSFANNNNNNGQKGISKKRRHLKRKKTGPGKANGKDYNHQAGGDTVPAKRTSLRNLRKVLASRILDTNATLVVKRKCKKVLGGKKDVTEKENTVSDKPAVEEEVAEENPRVPLIAASPKSKSKVANIKNFFPVRKKGKVLRSNSNKEDDDKTGPFGDLLRKFSLRKKKLDVVVKPAETKENLSRKRKLGNSIRKMIEKKKKKTKKSLPDSSVAFLEVAKEPDEPLAAEAVTSLPTVIDGVTSVAPVIDAVTVTPPLVIESVTRPVIEAVTPPRPVIDAVTVTPPLVIESVTPPVIEAVTPPAVKSVTPPPVIEAVASPSPPVIEAVILAPTLIPVSPVKILAAPKFKLKRPSRGLNDCIAMLTSKLNNRPPSHVAPPVLRRFDDESDCILKVPLCNEHFRLKPLKESPKAVEEIVQEYVEHKTIAAAAEERVREPVEVPKSVAEERVQKEDPLEDSKSMACVQEPVDDSKSVAEDRVQETVDDSKSVAEECVQKQQPVDDSKWVAKECVREPVDDSKSAVDPVEVIRQIVDEIEECVQEPDKSEQDLTIVCDLNVALLEPEIMEQKEVPVHVKVGSLRKRDRTRRPQPKKRNRKSKVKDDNREPETRNEEVNVLPNEEENKPPNNEDDDDEIPLSSLANCHLVNEPNEISTQEVDNMDPVDLEVPLSNFDAFKFPLLRPNNNGGFGPAAEDDVYSIDNIDKDFEDDNNASTGFSKVSCQFFGDPRKPKQPVKKKFADDPPRRATRSAKARALESILGDAMSDPSNERIVKRKSPRGKKRIEDPLLVTEEQPDPVDKGDKNCTSRESEEPSPPAVVEPEEQLVDKSSPAEDNSPPAIESNPPDVNSFKSTPAVFESPPAEEPSAIDLPKLNSDELFDLLKATPTDNMVLSKPTSSLFLNSFDDNDDISDDFIGDSFDVFPNSLEKSIAAIEENLSADKNFVLTLPTDDFVFVKEGEAKKGQRRVKRRKKRQRKSRRRKLLGEQIEAQLELKSNSSLFDNNKESIEDTTSTTSLLVGSYCDICQKSFSRVESLTKHKRTITHISKLSEIEAREAELSKSQVAAEQEEERPVLQDDNDNVSIKLSDIITDVLNKPIPSAEQDTFANLILNDAGLVYGPSTPPQNGEVKRHRSLGERKSFEQEEANNKPPVDLPTEFDTQISKDAGTILEKQISLLQNIIENRSPDLGYIDDANDDISVFSIVSNQEDTTRNDSLKICEDDNFLKPPPYDEISEDSNLKSRKVLNRDEELFLECCSLLKSGSEASSFSKRSRTVDPDAVAVTRNNNSGNNWLPGHVDEDEEEEEEEERQNGSCYVVDLDHRERPDYSCSNSRATPLGDYEDAGDENDSNTMSGWKINLDAQDTNTSENSSFTFEEVFSQNKKEKFSVKHAFRKIGDVSKAIKTKLDTWTSNITKKSDAFIADFPPPPVCDNKKLDELSDASTTDSKKLLTKGAMKVYDSLKVSIPTEELNINKILDTTKKPKKQQHKSKPRKNHNNNNNNTNKSADIYDFEETLDNCDMFTKPNDFRSFCTTKVDDSSLKVVAKKQDVAAKKKCMIMGRIFKNAAKSTLDDDDDDADEDIRTIPLLESGELVASCPPLPEQPRPHKMTEEELNRAFDMLLGDQAVAARPPPPPPPVKRRRATPTTTCRGARKRAPDHVESSTDDEFSLRKAPRKRGRRKEEDNSINLEQELKECMGVASRKSQRKCTSGKQNVLVEYWSSDESMFESLLEQSQIQQPVPTAETVAEEHSERNSSATGSSSKKTAARRKRASPKPAVPPPVAMETTAPTLSSQRHHHHHHHHHHDDGSTSRRKRAAANPLYHWSSSSEDESCDLIEIKPIRDDVADDYDNDDGDRPVQHGWIVGDSPKKLVTMLAQAKGKKCDSDSGVKEQKRRSSNFS